MHSFYKDQAYLIIKDFYANRGASRSRVPYINHIDEGLLVLEGISASHLAKQGFCLHPLVQETGDLKNFIQNGEDETHCARGFILAMEYRQVANRYLSTHYQSAKDQITISDLIEVNHMLVADKIQNRKDFEIYHADSHPRAQQLLGYFKNWLRVLGISEKVYQTYVSKIEAAHNLHSNQTTDD